MREGDALVFPLNSLEVFEVPGVRTTPCVCSHFHIVYFHSLE